MRSGLHKIVLIVSLRLPSHLLLSVDLSECRCMKDLNDDYLACRIQSMMKIQEWMRPVYVE